MTVNNQVITNIELSIKLNNAVHTRLEPQASRTLVRREPRLTGKPFGVGAEVPGVLSQRPLQRLALVRRHRLHSGALRASLSPLESALVSS